MIEQRKKAIYLAAGNADLKFNKIKVVYNDLICERDIKCDMLNVDLNDYDFLIATPPCNYWSKARGNKISEYAIKTRHLLIDIIIKFSNYDKPFIIENVKNIKRYEEEGILKLVQKLGLLLIIHGRHIYITNHYFDFSSVPQHFDFKNHGILISGEKNRQGGENVNLVIKKWLEHVEKLEQKQFEKEHVINNVEKCSR